LLDKEDGRLESMSLIDLIANSDHDAVMLLTPNAAHAEEVAYLADLRLPIFAEKPLATTRSSLEIITGSLEKNPKLYCSDFYSDVRAAPLLAWLDRPPAWLRANDLVVQGDMNLWHAGSSMVPGLQRVVSVLLEGEGQTGTFDNRPWLWDPVHGGVLWDLAYHYLTLWNIAFGKPLLLIHSDLKVADSSRADEVAETNAKLSLRSGSLEFQIEAGKYSKRSNDRWFRLEGDGWSATMTFGSRNHLVIQGPGTSCRVALVGNYYEHVSRAFRHYLDSGSNGPAGLDAAEAAIDIVLQAKTSLPAYRTLMLGIVGRCNR